MKLKNQRRFTAPTRIFGDVARRLNINYGSAANVRSQHWIQMIVNVGVIKMYQNPKIDGKMEF